MPKRSKNLWIALLLVAVVGPWGLLYISWLASVTFIAAYYGAHALMPWPKFVKAAFWWGAPALTAFSIILVQRLNESAAAGPICGDSDEFNPDASDAATESIHGAEAHPVPQPVEEPPVHPEPSETKVINGQVYVKINGEWFEK